ncbi:hypothetical protein A1O1_06209 [Capronia coronata CBS 617.96]|uniref:CST complex subunit Ten1 n=1 Tax=Capronia coronata CBS 617.96 TaxID=1182541 RepID=W9Y8B1_9EURO|nr:uncharacterized protein A1O1_06209 [Capronia coronata CBS 617.96]EXJ85840.1 hypothetical protein A1O1_06209 [Capronia coronata CBS 617.96]
MTQSASNGPTPSRFVFLSEIPSLPAATKVRFLGCVVDYDSLSGRLLLEHAFPKAAQPGPHALIDVNLILESTPSSVLERGRWVNVIGYVQNAHQGGRKRKATQLHNKDLPVFVQAILMWDAGPLRIADYEATLEEQIQMHRQIERRNK